MVDVVFLAIPFTRLLQTATMDSQMGAPNLRKSLIKGLLLTLWARFRTKCLWCSSLPVIQTERLFTV
jgi:hypothetical protein